MIVSAAQLDHLPPVLSGFPRTQSQVQTGSSWQQVDIVELLFTFILKHLGGATFPLQKQLLGDASEAQSSSPMGFPHSGNGF